MLLYENKLLNWGWLLIVIVIDVKKDGNHGIQLKFKFIQLKSDYFDQFRWFSEIF